MPRRLLATLVLALPVHARSAAPAPAAPAHDPAHPPIDCPLAAHGVSPSALRPFAETEKYIAFVEFKEGKLPEGPPESVKIPSARLVAMIEGAGFRLAGDDPGLLPYQTFLSFEKP